MMYLSLHFAAVYLASQQIILCPNSDQSQHVDQDSKSRIQFYSEMSAAALQLGTGAVIRPRCLAPVCTRTTLSIHECLHVPAFLRFL
jgi:hypothetical protein